MIQVKVIYMYTYIIHVRIFRYERRGWVTYSHSTDIREVVARLTTNKVPTHNNSMYII